MRISRIRPVRRKDNPSNLDVPMTVVNASVELSINVYWNAFAVRVRILVVKAEYRTSQVETSVRSMFSPRTVAVAEVANFKTKVLVE